ncbi:MAG: GntR family transcriptional regulator [Eubacteriales bacterium]|nr:GntR family transcriptional regulator [Eubacteriales bacterium]
MPNTIDRTVPIPLYFQLKQLLLNAIKDGTYPPGSMIPTENELVEMYSISRTTVRQAISELVQEGRLNRVKSKGTFVMDPKISQAFLSKIEPFNVQIRREGHVPSTEVLSFTTKNAGDFVSSNLGIDASEDVLCLQRRRFADDVPIVTIDTYLPDKFCHHLLKIDFSTKSLYDELSTSDRTRVVRIQRRVEATSAARQDVKQLDISLKAPILQIFSIGFNAYDEAIEFSIARYRGDRSSFTIDIAPYSS